MEIRLMKKIIFPIATLFMFGTVALADVKVGIINIEEVVSKSVKFKEAEKELKKRFEKEEKEITEEQQRVQKLAGEFSKNSPTMKEEDKKVQEKKITAEYVKLQKKQMEFQKKVGEESNVKQKKLLRQLESATKRVAEKDGIDLVLMKGIAIYSKEEMDITQNVIEQLNKADNKKSEDKAETEK